jgi:pimeloyl-ACP methyl ester carboxylesterase
MTMNASILYKTPVGEKAAMTIYDTALKHWPVAYQTRIILTRHGDTFVVSSGDENSPALILLHGAGGNSSMWAGDVAKYSANYRVYAVDLIGEAGKSAANRPAWDGPAYSEWLEDVLNGLKIEKATVVGLSQGAWAAVKFAVTAPDRVEKLVLMAPAGIVQDRPIFLLRAITMSLLGKWGIQHFVQALFGDQKVPDSVVERVAEVSMQFKPRIGVVPLFTDDELRRLTMPTLLMGGTKDIARDTEQIAERLRRLLPKLTVSIIDGAGHALINTIDKVSAFLVS